MTAADPIRAGDRVTIDGRPRVVLGASGPLIRFTDDEGAVEEAAVAELVGSGRMRLQPRGPGGHQAAETGLAGLPPEAVERARWWEAHIIEVVDGTPPDAPAGTPPRPAYDVERTSLREREQAKAAELSAPGRPVAASTVKHRRQRWQAEGLPGLVDRRVLRRRSPAGRADPAVAEAMEQAIAEATDESSRAASFIVWRTREILAGRGQTGTEPSRATMFRLFARLSAGKHTTGSAATRRGLAGRPQRMFSQAHPAAPGELMEIDSTPLDVLVLLDDGVPGRVELTGLIDVATRTVPAAVIRPTAKSVDASVLLARALTPEPMRPGWPASLAMAHSALPYDRLLGIDERLRHAAARPVIVPDTIVIDHGSVFVSGNFRASCRHLGISIQPAHLATGSDKPHIEKMFSSLGTLFCQFAAGYLGRNAGRRGRRVEEQPLWSLLQMQDLLDEWLISVWQNREHDGLRDPLHPQRAFSPNQKYAALLETAGYVPVPLSAGDYIELLPAVWRAVNAYGIKISHRTYDAGELNPIRQQKSGVTARKGQWEVHHDPYDVSRVFVRGPDGWITCPWKYLEKVPAPFGELAWDHVSGQLAGQGQPAPSELERALAVDDLLRRAYHGPPDDAGPQDPAPAGKSRRTGRQSPARDRRVTARTRAGTAARAGTGPEDRDPAATRDDPETPGQDSGGPLAKVIPLGIFDPFEEAKKPWVKGEGTDAAPAGAGDPHQHLSTLAGWREFTTLSPGQPELLNAAGYAAPGSDARAAYDQERLDYHTRLGVVGTSVLRQVVATGRRLTLLNRHAISARRGLILSGAAGTGKTTAITQLGKTHEATGRARHPGQERIPVIYVTVPPAATPRMLAMEFARFPGLPVLARANMTDIIEAVCGVAIDTSVSMVLVDEIHNMQLATRSGAEVSDTLKYLSERIPATFVYAGIDLERQGLFSGIRGSQIAGRFTLIPTLPFPLADEWRGLVATLEDALRLRRHQAGTLVGLDRYLHQRTGGMIGSLSHLIRGAAVEAIQSGSEQVTRKLPDTIDIDHAAQQGPGPGATAARRAAARR